MTQEILKLALDALEACNRNDMEEVNEAITAIKKALAQEQEPNWAWICNECGTQEFTLALCKADLDYLACSGCGSNEFHKEALAQEQEPVADDFFRMIADRNPKPFSSPQRTWGGLTDEEVKHEWEVWRANIPRYVGFAKGIEAKLKQKNGFAEEKNI